MVIIAAQHHVQPTCQWVRWLRHPATGPPLIDTVNAVGHEVAPRASVDLPKFEPVVGTLFLALEATGVEVKGRVRQNIRSALLQELLIEGR